MDPDLLADLAQRAALDVADRIVLADRGAVAVAATKTSATDLVTETDRRVEDELVRLLTTGRPDDAILAEERGRRGGDGPVTWIIDPIDGTTNFVYDLSGFNISIAAAVDGTVVAGIVVDPIRRETFRATLGGGATCNGTPIHVNRDVELPHALIGTGFSYSSSRRHEQAQVLASIMAEIRDIRRLGAAALDLCSVAAGRLDGYYESGLKPWDLAAGGLIASEAGAVVGGLDDGGPGERLTIAAHPILYDRLRGLLERARNDGLEVEGPSA